MPASNKPRIVVVCGGSGTGKSEWLKRLLAKSRRMIVWDVKREYRAAGCTELFRPSDLVQAMRSKQGRYAFIPPQVNQELFGFWSRCVLAWGDCDAIAEETADVTTPGKAPDGWGQLIRRGRDPGVRLYAVTQAPSESDKTVLRNHTLIHCCALKRDQDRAYMAREMGVEKPLLDALKPLEWIESDDMGKVRRGRISFKK